MTKQNKSNKKKNLKQEITALHLKGERGPAKTLPKHGKRNAFWQKIKKP